MRAASFRPDTISAAIALYWATTALFSLVQEFVVRRQLARKQFTGPVVTDVEATEVTEE